MDSVPTQLAISSMASGRPSSLRQSSAIACGATSAARKSGSRSAGPGDEQLHRIGGGDVRRARGHRRAVERRHRPADLAGNAEHDPAGDDDPQARARCEQVTGQLGYLGGDPLGPVEQQQPRRRGQRRSERLQQRLAVLVVAPAAGRRAPTPATWGSGPAPAARRRRRYAGTSRLSTSAASRVLPAPPGPMSVTSRD